VGSVVEGSVVGGSVVGGSKVGAVTLVTLGAVEALVDVLVVALGSLASSPLSPWVSRKTAMPPPTMSSAAMIAMTMPTELFPDGGCPPP